MKGIILALILLGITGLVLTALFPLSTIIGSLIASIAALLEGIGFLVLILSDKHC